MSVLIPTIYAVIPSLGKVLPDIKALYDENERAETLNVKKLGEFVMRSQNIHLARIDDPEKPFITRDKTGNEILIMAWGHPINPLEGDYIVALICKKDRDGNGREMFMPQSVLRGAKANVLIVGGMSCCGTALQAHWTHIADTVHIDASRVPATGLPQNHFKHWLRGKVRFIDTVNNSRDKSFLEDMARDIVSARFPERVDLKPISERVDYLSLGSGPQ